MTRRFLVIREYSGPTTKKMFWEIKTRPLKLRSTAEQLMGFEKDLAKKQRKRGRFFVIELDGDTTRSMYGIRS